MNPFRGFVKKWLVVPGAVHVLQRIKDEFDLARMPSADRELLKDFYDHANEHAMKPYAGSVSFADSEFQMRRHAEIFRKYKYHYSIRRNIFNANANLKHYLDVFPKVDYDELFTDSMKRNQAREA